MYGLCSSADNMHTVVQYTNIYIYINIASSTSKWIFVVFHFGISFRYWWHFNFSFGPSVSRYLSHSVFHAASQAATYLCIPIVYLVEIMATSVDGRAPACSKHAWKRRIHTTNAHASHIDRHLCMHAMLAAMLPFPGQNIHIFCTRKPIREMAIVRLISLYSDTINCLLRVAPFFLHYWFSFQMKFRFRKSHFCTKLNSRHSMK